MSSMFGTGVSSTYNTTTTTFGNGANSSFYASYLDAGTPGPTGPQGPAGPTGPQGPPGTIPNDIVCNSLTAQTIATYAGVNGNSVQLTDAGIAFYENQYQYFSLDNNVPGGNTLRVFTSGVNPGVALTISEEGIVNMTKDVTIGGQLVVDGPLDVSGVIVGTSAAITGTVQANTANVNNITAAISVLNIGAGGGINVTNDLTMNGASLLVADIGLTGSDARIDISPGISDKVITTSQLLLPTNIPAGGSVSYTLNYSTDTPNNWFSGLYGVSATLTVGGASIPFCQALFSLSPNNVSNIFQQFGIGITLAVGADVDGNPVLQFTNTSGGAYNTPLNLRILKIC